ncbi:MAG: hypothetical protein CM1200mP13_13920 [Candidatus Pelagibacterales bacterium]|nr:MAG: hypothetical protein CM1200mP13_13920 [Pelagibacterales bacterium]
MGQLFSRLLFTKSLNFLSSVVLISSQILFSDKPFKIPSLLSITSAETSGEGREVIIKSDCSANSLGDFAILAPSFLNELVKPSSIS